MARVLKKDRRGWTSARRCKTGDPTCVHVCCAKCGADGMFDDGVLPEHVCPASRAVAPVNRPLDDPRLARLLAGAAAHGEQSEPDHEAGDLLDILRAAWGRLGEEDRAALATQFAHVTQWTTDTQ